MRTRPARFSPVLFLLLCGSVLPALPADSAIFIGSYAVEDKRARGDRSNVLSYDLAHEQPALLEEALSGRIAGIVRNHESISFEIHDYPAAAKPAGAEIHLRASFLIDYSEPVFDALLSQVVTTYGPEPTPKQLEDFVFDYVETKDYGHGFDIASRVAETRAGDCTEHAVLLTALLRAFGYPARMVVGIFVHLSEQKGAFGHAWTEYFIQGKWLGLDGTQIIGAVDHHYLPISVIQDESLSYGLAMINGVSRMNVSKIVVR